MKGLMMDYPLTTQSILDYGNRVFPHKQIISILPDGSRHQYRYADLYKRTKKLASALTRRLDIGPGDRVATLAWNHYQHLELYYAIPGVAAVCHTLNLRLSTEQIEFIINHAEDKVIFADATVVHMLEKIAPLTPTVRSYVILNAPRGFSTTLPNTIDYEGLIADEPEDFPWIGVEETDACAMCYTSGTTGNSKGVLYSHRSTYLHALAALAPNGFDLGAHDRMLVISPMFHAMAWGTAFIAILAGADLIFPSSHLHTDELVQILSAEKATKANGVPTIWLGIFDELKKHPPAEKLCLREFICGGSTLPKSLIAGFEREFGIHGVHLWGMTETSPMGTSSRLQPLHEGLDDDEKFRIRGKQGIEMPGVEIKLITEEGEDAPRDGTTMGEILIRGPWIASAYFKVEDNSSHITKDGWLRTGDVATIDQYGYMEIMDRTKDLIKSGGEWISSVALEVALIGHPKIREACVIAVPHEKWVERPLACIVLCEGAEISQKELKMYLERDFAHYQIPDKFVVVSEIPKTSVGKFNKKELRRMYAAQELA
jgi:fatty-acyl-CoA synthase